MFSGEVNNFKVYLALYVDDGLIMCESQAAIKVVLGYLKSNFQITENEANEFIGMKITRDRSNRQLNISYITKIINRFGMSDANPSSVPAEPGLFLQKHDAAKVSK